VDSLLRRNAALSVALEAARQEAADQMQSKLDAQVTLKAITDSLGLVFSELGNGWREAAPKILARIEEIVDKGNRGFDQLDAAEAELARLREERDGYHRSNCELTALGIDREVVIERLREELRELQEQKSGGDDAV
jgi:uncharacterized coiled-coil DUF342 family protein